MHFDVRLMSWYIRNLDGDHNMCLPMDVTNLIGSYCDYYFEMYCFMVIELIKEQFLEYNVNKQDYT